MTLDPPAAISMSSTGQDEQDAAAEVNIEDALANLARAERGRSPVASMRVLVQRYDEVADRLLAEIAATPAKVLERSKAADAQDCAFVLLDAALLVLAHYGETRAYAPIVEFLSADSYVADEVLGTVVTEDLAAILARTYDGGSLDSLKALIEDEQAAPYVRLACLNAVHGMARLGKLPREAVIAYYVEALERMRTLRNADIADLIVHHAANIQSPVLRPSIDRYFDDDLVNTRRTDRTSIDKCYLDDAAEIDRAVLAAHHFDDVVEYFASWSWFQDPETRAQGFHALVELLAERMLRRRSEQSLEAAMGRAIVLPYTRPGAKVGRNEPCTCGSGKKYKKCCLGTEH